MTLLLGSLFCWISSMARTRPPVVSSFSSSLALFEIGCGLKRTRVIAMVVRQHDMLDSTDF